MAYENTGTALRERLLLAEQALEPARSSRHCLCPDDLAPPEGKYLQPLSAGSRPAGPGVAEPGSRIQLPGPWGCHPIALASAI